MLYVSTLLDRPWVLGIVALVGEEFHQCSTCQSEGAPSAEGVCTYNHVLLGQGLLHLLFGSNVLN